MFFISSSLLTAFSQAKPHKELRCGDVVIDSLKAIFMHSYGMKICGRLLFLCCLVFVSSKNAWANDSSYFASGNQIIPLQETDISVKKEILTMKRIADEKVRITVSYTFHNPGKEKSLLMGFEAGAPYGDVDGTPRNGEHPYIEKFSVNLNGEMIPHKVSIFQPTEQKEREWAYHIDDLKKPQVIPEIENQNETGFFYVYHFPATFPAGESQVTHSSEYAMSGSVFTQTGIDYMLSPALRWANQEIEDFTLIIDLGEFQQFHVLASFFDDLSSWRTQGKVKIAMQDVRHQYADEASRVMTVWQQHGSVTFTAKNFRPKGELSIISYRSMSNNEELDVKAMELAFHDLPNLEEKTIKDEFSRKALANFPYARRGYVFQNQQLRAFYEKQPWYLPDPNYKAAGLSDEEQQWLAELAELKLGK
jgi:hypothetical protein